MSRAPEGSGRRSGGVSSKVGRGLVEKVMARERLPLTFAIPKRGWLTPKAQPLTPEGKQTKFIKNK